MRTHKRAPLQCGPVLRTGAVAALMPGNLRMFGVICLAV
jgi:hypothetical protein